MRFLPARLTGCRKLGAMLRDMPKNAGGNPNLLHDATGYTTLADLGIERTASHRWQTMADGATLEATAAAAGVAPNTVRAWTEGDSALQFCKAVGKDGKSYPATYRPRAV